MDPVIFTQNLGKKYGQKTALRDINLQVQEGDFFAFIGPNGAGKSTTIRILLGLINKSSGTAKLFDQEVGPKKHSLLQGLAYVPAEANFYPKLKVREVFDLAQRIDSGISPAQLKELTHEFDLDQNKRVKDLSLGNRKKIALVLALSKQADLYILDEPTSGLDPLMQQIFWQAMVDRHRHGATIFVSSHILSEVQKYCQQVAIIRQGQIIAQGAMQDLFADHHKQVTIKGNINLAELVGVSHLQEKQDSHSFLYSGNLTNLLTYLHQVQVQIDDLTIQQPDLETLFMHYYQVEKEGDLNGLAERN